MRFLALQTDIEVLKKQNIPESEHEIMTVRRHAAPFVLDFIWKTAAALTLVSVFGLVAVPFLGSVGSSTVVDGLLSSFFLFVLFVLLVLVYFYQIIKSYIAWRYNFLIITSDKIIIIDHHSFIHQDLTSIHLETITSSKFESQYFGLFRCGILHIHLQEREGQGSTRVVTVPRIPAPDVVASAIEHAITLKQQRAKGTESPAVQEQKAEVIKESLQEQTKEAVVSPPPLPEPPPEPPPAQ